jgi:hypothetical protein
VDAHTLLSLLCRLAVRRRGRGCVERPTVCACLVAVLMGSVFLLTRLHSCQQCPTLGVRLRLRRMWVWEQVTQRCMVLHLQGGMLWPRHLCQPGMPLHSATLHSTQ